MKCPDCKCRMWEKTDEVLDRSGNECIYTFFKCPKCGIEIDEDSQ